MVAVLMPARSDALFQARGSGIQVTPDGEQVLVNKEVDAQRWTITRNLDDLTVTGNVFFPEGGDPLFVFCEQQGQSGGQVQLACSGADACSENTCPEFAFIDDVVLPESFFEPPVAVAAIAARIEEAVASVSTGSAGIGGVKGTGTRGSGIQITPDDRRVLINKDVGDQRWSITRNLDDLTVSGNVFFAAGGEPLFVFCEQQGQSGGQVDLSCSGANRCTEAGCPGFEFLADVTLPESFFTPPGSPGPIENLSTIQGRVRDVVGGAASAAGGAATPSQLAGIVVEARQGDRTLDVATTDAEGRFFLEFNGGGEVELSFAVEDVLVTLSLSILPGSVVTLEVELRVDDDEVVVIDEPDVVSPPIRCETGTLQIVDEELDLVVDGRGEDCLRAENDCVIDIAARSVTLVDCERCVAAQSNAEILISTAPGGLVCEARKDGIRAESSSRVLIDGLDGVSIAAFDGSGIRAESNAEVVLTSEGTCLIEAGEDAIRTESNAVVDLSGCADVVLDDGGDDDDDDDDGDDDDDDDFGDDDD
jgi:hypothetical protein